MNFQNNTYIAHDSTTGAVHSIDHNLVTLHDGQNFNTFIRNTSLSTGGTEAICFSVGTCGCHLHLIPSIESSGSGYLEIIEGCSWNSTTGTARIIFNHNRNSSLIPRVLQDTSGTFKRDGSVIHNPTGITGGTVIEHLITNAAKKAGDSITALDEWMLKQGEKYCIKYTSEATGNSICIRLGWYEHI
jgi:hypothetical protein